MLYTYQSVIMPLGGGEGRAGCIDISQGGSCYLYPPIVSLRLAKIVSGALSLVDLSHMP